MAQFHWADYLVFVAMLVVSLSTGVYFAYKGRKHQDAEEFLMAGRRMHVLPVAFSIFVSWLSGISFIGDPVESYRYGFIYILLVAGYIVGSILASFCAPKFHEMRITSAYEFLEVKYSKGMRIFSSLAIMSSLVMWLGVATYAPALALSQASGMPVWLTITIIGLVCTFYTTIGGMKAVLWADTIQLVVMFAGQVAIVVRGSIRVGGMTEVLRIAAEGGRLNFKQSLTDFNPLSRASLWMYFIGGVARVFCPYISNQVWIQRFCTVRTPRDARLAVLLSIPLYAVMCTLIGCGGLIMYAVYSDCDPVLNGEVQRWDQMVAYLVIDLLGFLPGVPGLFLATVFAASLSSMSSGMNGMAAMLLKDFTTPIYEYYTGRRLSTHLETVLSKVFALAAGLAITGFAFLPFVMGSSIFVMTNLFEGCVFGPTAGVFFLALFVPRVKSVFVHIAYIVSMALCLVLGLLSYILPPRGPWEDLPLTTSGCPNNVTSGLYNATSTPIITQGIYEVVTPFDGGVHEKPSFSFKHIYEMNSLLYNLVGLATVIVIAGTFQILSYCKDCCTGGRCGLRYQSQPIAQHKDMAYDNGKEVEKPSTEEHGCDQRRNGLLKMRNLHTTPKSRTEHSSIPNDNDNVDTLLQSNC